MVNEFNAYQEAAMGTRIGRAWDPNYALFGLPGEVGEVMSLFAKDIRDTQHDLDEKLKKELGDVLWFIAAIAHDNGFKLSDIAAANIAKLEDRQARGVLQGSGDNR